MEAGESASDQGVPSFTEFMRPTIDVLRQRGGQATIAELLDLVPAEMGLTPGQLAQPHKGGQTEVAYRMAWARTYLKRTDLIRNSGRGVWALTEKGRIAHSVDGRAIARDVRDQFADDEEGDPEVEQTNTYLLAWNPRRFEWENLDAQIKAIEETGVAEDSWTCGQVKHIPPGSRFFLIRLGTEPRGLVGSGITIDDIREQPHWEPERAARGETTHFVDIKFDVLSRTPLVRRAELGEPPFDAGKWDTQMSGIRIPDDVAAALEREWRRRAEGRARGDAPAVLPLDAIERWRDHWAEAQKDLPWVERHRVRDSKRMEAIPEIAVLITGFLEGGVSLPEFRETFDRKTRNEWDLFGLKGLSGAMFLNKLAKHLPEQQDVTKELQNAIRAPADESSARRQIDGLMGYLDGQIESGKATGAELQPNRASFFVGACWHIQRPQQWPIMYQSARLALQADGLLGRNVEAADGYLEFARLFRALTTGLNISFWDLEHLCVRLRTPEADADDLGAADLEPDEAPQNERVWLMAPGRRAEWFDEFYKEGIIAIGWGFTGNLSEYADVDEIRQAIQQHRGGATNPVQDALACFQFAHEMEVGDVVFVKRGRREIIGYGIVTSEYRHEPQRARFTHVRSVEWKLRGEWVPRDRPLVTKTLTEIGKYPSLVADIRRALKIGEEADPNVETTPRSSPAYSLDDAAEDLFLPRAEIEEAVELLRYKKNLVLQGPPGVGKSFFAKRLGFLLLGEKDPDRMAQVQFHQSYAYEDFVQGYRPVDDGKFARVDGPFMRFCDQALQDTDSAYVLLIDEINRANLSRVFGELLLLIEGDKRSENWAATLTYSREGEPAFYVPKNLHIIGTMNTADRSLALVDYALRRRFAFLDIRPGFGHAAFDRRMSALGVEAALRARVITRLQRLNDRIREDTNLGEGFCIGHSYFCHADGARADEAWYKRIVRTEIGPLLREYWFDDVESVDEQVARLLDDD